MEQAKDYIGNNISKGDTVAFVLPNKQGSYREFAQADILNITPKTVVLDYINHQRSHLSGEIRQKHTQVIKVVKE